MTIQEVNIVKKPNRFWLKFKICVYYGILKYDFSPCFLDIIYVHSTLAHILSFTRTVVIVDRKENDRATKNLSLELPNTAFNQLLEERTSRFLWNWACLYSKSAGHLSQRHPQRLGPDSGQLKQRIISFQEMNCNRQAGSQWYPIARGSEDDRAVGRRVWFQFSMALCSSSEKAMAWHTTTSGSKPTEEAGGDPRAAAAFSRNNSELVRTTPSIFHFPLSARPHLELNTETLWTLPSECLLRKCRPHGLFWEPI